VLDACEEAGQVIPEFGTGRVGAVRPRGVVFHHLNCHPPDANRLILRLKVVLASQMAGWRAGR
jgi:hypothetical protein